MIAVNYGELVRLRPWARLPVEEEFGKALRAAAEEAKRRMNLAMLALQGEELLTLSEAEERFAADDIVDWD